MGHRNQVVAVAEALGRPFLLREVRYTSKGGWPNMLRGASLRGVDVERSDVLLPRGGEGGFPALVIAAGRRLAPVARAIKREAMRHKKECRIVQIMWPGFPAGVPFWLSNFDLVAVPEHDRLPFGVAHLSRVLRVTGAPHHLTDKVLGQESAMWDKTLQNFLPHVSPETKHVAVLLGGHTRTTEMHMQHVEKMVAKMRHVASHSQAFFWVSTSRRTPQGVVEALPTLLQDIPHYLHRFVPKQANPYIAFIARADAVIVTGDSISMCCEACAGGVPVYIEAPEGMVPTKHRRLHDTLYTHGYAAPFDQGHAEVLPRILTLGSQGDKNPLNAAYQVAEAIVARGWC